MSKLRVLLIAERQDRANYVLQQLYTENIDQIERYTTSGFRMKDGTVIRAVSMHNMKEQIMFYDCDQIFITNNAYHKYPEYVERAMSHVYSRSCVPYEYMLVVLDD